MKNSDSVKTPKINSLELLPQIMNDLKTPLNTIFSFSELLKFEVERKKKLKVVSSSEFDNYADYAKEISNAVFEVNKIFEELMQRNRQLSSQLNEKK